MKCGALLDCGMAREILLQSPEHIPERVLGPERLPQASSLVPGENELQSALDATGLSESDRAWRTFTWRHSGFMHEID